MGLFDTLSDLQGSLTSEIQEHMWTCFDEAVEEVFEDFVTSSVKITGVLPTYKCSNSLGIWTLPVTKAKISFRNGGPSKNSPLLADELHVTACQSESSR